MEILYVEDEQNKAHQVMQVIKDNIPSANIYLRNSYNAALMEINRETLDLVLLDMSLPLYDISKCMEYEEDNDFETFAGIAESSISDWKKKHTNPVSDKILIICEVLDISPYELLSGAEHIGTRSRDNQTCVFAKDTELGMVVETYQQLDYKQQKRLLGYMDALKMNN